MVGSCLSESDRTSELLLSSWDGDGLQLNDVVVIVSKALSQSARWLGFEDAGFVLGLGRLVVSRADVPVVKHEVIVAHRHGIRTVGNQEQLVFLQESQVLEVIPVKVIELFIDLVHEEAVDRLLLVQVPFVHGKREVELVGLGRLHEEEHCVARVGVILHVDHALHVRVDQTIGELFVRLHPSRYKRASIDVAGSLLLFGESERLRPSTDIPHSFCRRLRKRCDLCITIEVVSSKDDWPTYLAMQCLHKLSAKNTQ